MNLKESLKEMVPNHQRDLDGGATVGLCCPRPRIGWMLVLDVKARMMAWRVSVVKTPTLCSKQRHSLPLELLMELEDGTSMVSILPCLLTTSCGMLMLPLLTLLVFLSSPLPCPLLLARLSPATLRLLKVHGYCWRKPTTVFTELALWRLAHPLPSFVSWIVKLTRCMLLTWETLGSLSFVGKSLFPPLASNNIASMPHTNLLSSHLTFKDDPLTIILPLLTFTLLTSAPEMSLLLPLT